MELKGNAFVDGYIEKDTKGGGYVGELKIEGIDISPIVGVYFKTDGEYWLWLKRKPVVEYNDKTQEFVKRKPIPMMECYLKKTKEKVIAYRGEFIFCHFCFKIIGMWDVNMREKERLNFFVERAKMSEQKIINIINQNKRNNNE